MNGIKTMVWTLIVLTGLSVMPARGGTLRLDRTTFSPGERITVRFSGAEDYAGNAWVGIIPSGIDHGREAVNDRYDLTYQYLHKKGAGQLTFHAPEEPGRYDFRLHDTDNDGREVAYVSFTVMKRADLAAAGGAALELDRTDFEPSARATVRFTAPPDFPDNAWVGIVPSPVDHGREAENDRHDLSYQYLKGRTAGTLTFTVPDAPGAYDFRMHDTDDNGREVAWVSFTVALDRAAPLLGLEKGVFAPLEAIHLSFSVPEGLPGDAWVGIIPSRVAHGSESVNDAHDLTYQYLKGRTEGVLMFTAPAAAGAYDFRLHDTDSNGRELTSISFRVGD